MKSPTPRKKREPARTINCDWCGEAFTRYPSKMKPRNYCSRACLGKSQSKIHNPDGYRKLKDFSNIGKHLPELNRALNPTRMTPEVRAKLREAHLGKGEGKFYEKTFGRHTHRIVMEAKLGRPLKSDEIVHHIDGNHRNNDPDNLQLVTRAEHIRIHHRQGDMRRKNDPLHPA